MNHQPFVQLNQAQGPQGPMPQPFQGGFANGHMNQAGPTPPPRPPMGQMPPIIPGGQLHHGGDFRRNSFTPSPVGRRGSYDPPSPGSVGSGRSYHRPGHAGRHARPVIHNALERRTPPKKEVYDLRTKVTSEQEAKDALSTYHVWSIKKDGTGTGFAESGIPVVPTWERATHFHDTGVSQEEAARRVWELQAYTDPVSRKKSKLASVIQEQLDHSQEELEYREEDPRFCYQLVQFDQSIKRVDVSPHFTEQYIEDGRKGSSSRRSRSRDRYASKDKKDRKRRDKYKKGFYLYETPKYKGTKHRTQKQTDSITAYYRRVPREGVNCLQMWDDLQNGYDSWGSANSSPRFPPQQPFAAIGQHGHHGGHQGPHMGMNRPDVQPGFPPPNHFKGHQQGGFPPNQPFGAGGNQGLGLNQPMPHPQQQQHGFQQHPPQQGMNPHQGFPQQGMNNHQGFPQQAQYAHGQGPINMPQQGQPGGAHPFRPGDQQHNMQGGFPPQGHAGQPGVQQPPFAQDFRHGPQPRGNQFPPAGQRNNPVNGGNMPNQTHRPMPQRPGQQGQRGPNMPPVPPQHGRPGSRNGGKPIRVFPTSGSPRSSANSLTDSDDDSGNDSGFDTPPSSVNSDGRRGRPRHKNTRSRSRSQSHGPKPRGFPARSHSRGGAQRYSRSVSPPIFRPKSAMRDTSRPGFGRNSPWQNDFGRSCPRRSMDDFDQVPIRPRMNAFDREMFDRTTDGQFNHRFPPRKANSVDFDYEPPWSHIDIDRTARPSRETGEWDDPRVTRGGARRGFRAVSPFARRQAMFQDDMDFMSDRFDNLRFDKGFGANRGHFQGGDRFGHAFKDRFKTRGSYDDGDDDEFKRTRFADGAPGRDYGRPTATPFGHPGGRPFGPRRPGPMYDD